MSQSQRIAEQNARASARGVYLRWLAQRFGTLDLMLTRQGEDRVSLRRIYVPVRVDTKDRADESLGGPEQAHKEQLPGEDALALIASSRFVAICGRPGSGKTTLVQALLAELTRDGPSPVRTRLVGTRGLLPVPLLLRDYQDRLDAVRRLDDLLDLWWDHAAREAGATGHALDLARLRASYAAPDGAGADGDGMGLLVLFDGLDEVGGQATRQRLLDLAAAPDPRVSCALVTGRPGGFADLPDWRPAAAERVPDSSALPDAEPSAGPAGLRLHHLQPFAFPQIQAFIGRFLQLRQEWQVEARRLLEEFNGALQDPRRPHLLNLARRPIFLTLMALVHVNERRMPHGRADLYERIVDLYLNRQMQHKRLAHTLRAEPMPQWDQREVRRALGYLAWRSQHLETTGEPAPDDRRRQVIWSRAELEDALRVLLAGKTDDRRGFSDLVPADAPQLLDYYLHPAGLLVDPAEGRYQFAHLSFQEFLCAEYIHGRAKAHGSRRFLDGIAELLYPFLGGPGWDEVGLLLLCIHAAEGRQTDPEAHLELLGELAPAELPQARLLVAALTGQELDYSEAEHQRWLPLAVVAALLHPMDDLAGALGRVAVWKGPGLALLRALFDSDAPLDVLAARLGESPPAMRFGGAKVEMDERLASAQRRWRDLGNALNWEFPFDHEIAQAWALLVLANESGWLPRDPKRPQWRPLTDAALEQQIAAWVGRALARRPADGARGWLTRRIKVLDASSHLPVSTPVARELNALLMAEGPLWECLAPRMPLDLWLLQGEFTDDSIFGLASQPLVSFSLAPTPGAPNLPAILRLALGLYQALILAEALGGAPTFAGYAARRLNSLVQSLWRSRSRSRSLPHRRSLLRTLSQLTWTSLSRGSFVGFLCLQLELVGVVSEPTRGVLERIEDLANHLANHLAPGHQAQVREALAAFAYCWCAHDWFAEQAAHPDLMRRRGLPPGEPLPRAFGLFAPDGRLPDHIPRAGLLQLRDWLADDDAVLRWLFPAGLGSTDAEHVHNELQTLHHRPQPDGSRGQPWSPLAAIEAVLADWPADVPIRDISLAYAERTLLAALEEILAAHEEGQAGDAPD